MLRYDNVHWYQVNKEIVIPISNKPVIIQNLDCSGSFIDIVLRNKNHLQETNSFEDEEGEIFFLDEEIDEENNEDEEEDADWWKK